MTVEERTIDDLDVGESDTAGSDPAESHEGDELSDTKPVRRLRLSISVRTLTVAVVIAALVVGVGVLGWLYIGARHQLDIQAGQSESTRHAEQVALDYAVNAAELNSEGLDTWKTKLVAGVSPELKEKLSKAAVEMEQILVPLKWSSTARPLVAKVRAETAGVYVVDCFVSVLTKTVQGPEPLQSTATYSVTIDGNRDWEITNVGGIGTVVEQK